MNLPPDHVADSTMALQVLEALKEKWPSVEHLFGDAAYDPRQLMDNAAFLGFTLQAVRRLQGRQG